MKKKKPYNVASLIMSNKEKNMLKLANNPKAMEQILEINRSLAKIEENKKTIKASNMDEWYERAFSILPESKNTEEIKNKLKLKIEELFNDTFNE